MAGRYHSLDDDDHQYTAMAVGYLAGLPRDQWYGLLRVGFVPSRRRGQYRQAIVIRQEDALNYLGGRMQRGWELPSPRPLEPSGCGVLRGLLARWLRREERRANALTVDYRLPKPASPGVVASGAAPAGLAASPRSRPAVEIPERIAAAW